MNVFPPTLRFLRKLSLLSSLIGSGLGIGTAWALEAPTITTPPASMHVAPRESAVLSVVVDATETPVFQWYLGESGDLSSPVIGATGPMLVTQALNTNARFWVRASNSSGASDSPAVTVFLDTANGKTLRAFGRNRNGQLGDGSTLDQTKPVRIARGVTSVAAGNAFMLFTKSDGTLWSTGYNGSGQLADGTNNERHNPMSVATNVISVAAGALHTLFVKDDSTLWAVGFGGSGELGNSSMTSSQVPIPVATDVASVTAYHSHTLYIKRDGTLWAMGVNSGSPMGAVGTATGNILINPVQIATGVASVTTTDYHTLFVKTDGSLWATGSNSAGQLGDGSSFQPTPVQVASGVVSASAGAGSSFFIKSDGTLWAMGDNGYGQLGDGTTETRFAPVQIDTSVRQVSSGGFHTLYVKNDGSLWSAGRGNYGQLGDGATVDHPTPTRILPHSWSAYTDLYSSYVLTPPDFIDWEDDQGVDLYRGDAAPAADADQDGVPNLAEYALGTSPILPNTAPAWFSITRDTIDGQPSLALVHRRNKNALVNISYEKSNDLLSWLPVTLTPEVINSDADGNGSVELVRVALPMNTDANSRIFLRMRVSE